MAISVKFKHGPRADYERVLAAGQVDKDTLYFIEDTGEIFHGERNLARGSHYEGIRGEVDGVAETDLEVIARVITDGEHLIVKDDIFVVKTPIANDKTSFTSYVYDGEKWCAMDGNYNAENVYFDDDFTFTKEVGYVTLENGSATVEAKGKNIKQLFETLFSKELDPTVTPPSTEITVSSFKAYEVGTTVENPAFSVTFDAGAYEFGPAPTGVSAVTYTVTCNGETLNTATGNFKSIQVTDSTSLSAKVVVDYSAGNTPLTNLGNNVTTEGVAIVAGQCSDTSSTLSGYRKMFWGVSQTADLTSDVIRGLAQSKKPANGLCTRIEAGEGAVCAIVAIPAAAKKTISSVLMPSSMNADATKDFVKQEESVFVAGAENYAGVAYDVWVYQPSKLSAGSTFDITIANA